MSDNTRRFWRSFGESLLVFAVILVVVSVIFALIGGVASILQTDGIWLWSWCLRGVWVALGVLFFIGVPFSWAGDRLHEEEQNGRLKLERSANQELSDRLREWTRLQGVAPFQDAVDTLMHILALNVQEAEARAQAVANEVLTASDDEAVRKYALRLERALRESANARSEFVAEQNRVRKLGFGAQDLPVYLAMPGIEVLPD